MIPGQPELHRLSVHLRSALAELARRAVRTELNTGKHAVEMESVSDLWGSPAADFLTGFKAKICAGRYTAAYVWFCRPRCPE